MNRAYIPDTFVMSRLKVVGFQGTSFRYLKSHTN